MHTFEEIKEIVYPKENIDMVEVVKDLLHIKYNDGELVTFGEIYLYPVGDSNEYLNGLALVNGNLICVTSIKYGGDYDALFLGVGGKEYRRDIGIKLTDEALLKACKKILEEKIKIDFDLSNFKALDNYYIDGGYLEKTLNENLYIKEEVTDFCNGKRKGYVKL